MFGNRANFQIMFLDKQKENYAVTKLLALRKFKFFLY